MYAALGKIFAEPRERSGNIQNVVRWYYRFCDSQEFPRLWDNGCGRKKKHLELMRSEAGREIIRREFLEE